MQPTDNTCDSNAKATRAERIKLMRLKKKRKLDIDGFKAGGDGVPKLDRSGNGGSCSKRIRSAVHGNSIYYHRSAGGKCISPPSSVLSSNNSYGLCNVVDAFDYLLEPNADEGSVNLELYTPMESSNNFIDDACYWESEQQGTMNFDSYTTNENSDIVIDDGWLLG